MNMVKTKGKTVETSGLCMCVCDPKWVLKTSEVIIHMIAGDLYSLKGNDRFTRPCLHKKYNI